jgi:phosphoribosylformylglycinamidine synthase
MDKRVFIERQKLFQVEAKQLEKDIREILQINVINLRYFVVYDLFGISESLLNQIVGEILHEANKDIVHYIKPDTTSTIAYEYLPGQFDQRASSAEQCAKLLDPSTEVFIRSGVVVTTDNGLSEDEFITIKKLLINPVDSREKDLTILEKPIHQKPQSVRVFTGFIQFNINELRDFHLTKGFAMSLEDLSYIQDYFIKKDRNPSETELRVLDTYWSDHCRHTTFETSIDSVSFQNTPYGQYQEEIYKDYLDTRSILKRSDKPITLMDLATINSRYESYCGNLSDLEVSEEINAASIFIDVDIDGIIEKWLLMFKNETHNHPTEIEPYGGASTCIGGAIRDPLSGRSYVYGAMRVTGAADLSTPYEGTLDGKLPQRIISKEAAHGYSSYGNQIGLATTFVEEIHHPGYLAKRMEIGAVIGAVKASHVRRESPSPGDAVILLGGRTGRDGIGGATGSSKEHTMDSLDDSGAEVQKGNAPEERKIQRLFRNPEVTRLVKKSNDFGAGGVSVAIGELADGLTIDLDKIPIKYEGIDGTELAISESQERMAVVVSPSDINVFLDHCTRENIEAIVVAEVTADNKLTMKWNNDVICSLDRDFIDSSGVRQHTTIIAPASINHKLLQKSYLGDTLTEQIRSLLQDSNIASKQGLEEMFDSTIGRTTILAPYGGRYQQTKTQVSCHIIPTRRPHTNTASLMAYGFNPFISDESPFHGSSYAIIESMAKIVSAGGDYKKIRFTFQEYFQKLGQDPIKWGKPFSALLGAFHTLKQCGLAAIGGKDSMSGSYHDIHVPPTLVSFAVTTLPVENVLSPEWKKEGHHLYLLDISKNRFLYPNIDELKHNFNLVHEYIKKREIVSAYAIAQGGLAEALIKPTFGNFIGINIRTSLSLFDYRPGAIVVESITTMDEPQAIYLGTTTRDQTITINDTSFLISEALRWNQSTYRTMYPITHEEEAMKILPLKETARCTIEKEHTKEVRVLIPVFPGTNCEYDSEDVFKQEGAITDIFVFNTLSETSIHNTIDAFVSKLKQSHILMLSGGFSSGDEPDGSGKFIASVLRHNKVQKAINEFLQRKHLILGICNGFQALVKAGLLPYGQVQPIKKDAPTLFKNKVNRHVSKFVQTSISSTTSPWLSSFQVGDIHTIPVSHGEGRFIVHAEMYRKLYENNQIAFQYVDEDGTPTMNPSFNPNGSSYAIEGIISEDGLILGKMGHSERYQESLFQNIHGDKSQNIFRNAVQYFTGGMKQ